MNGWQPIETIPKDCTRIQVWIVSTVGSYWNPHAYIEDGNLYVSDGYGYDVPLSNNEKATHWMPQPEPPKGE